MGNTPSGYELTDSDAKKCVVLDSKSSYWKAIQNMDKNNIILSNAEIVVHIRPENHHDDDHDDGNDDINMLVIMMNNNNNITTTTTTVPPPPPPPSSSLKRQHHHQLNLPPPKQVRRVFRVAALTNSVFHLAVKDDFMSQACGSCMPGAVNYDASHPVTIAFGQMRLITHDPDKHNVVVMGYKNVTAAAVVVTDADVTDAAAKKKKKNENNKTNTKRTMQWTMYQTPDMERLLLPLLRELQKSYVGVPTWAIPLKWNLPFHIPKLQNSEIIQYYGDDGGFSTVFLYKVQAILARRARISRNAYAPRYNNSTQPQRPWSVQPSLGKAQKYFGKTPQIINISVFGDDINLKLAVLDSIPFNLTFRILKARNARIGVSNWSTTNDYPTLLDFHSSLSRVLMYNVTLREVDLSGTTLAGGGEMIGQAFATNIQPLISRLNLSGCQISNRDFRLMIPGLARLWCCGSVDPVSFDISSNPNISNASFQFFWKVLLDPHLLFCWPSSPPPPVNTRFWQHLNIQSTQAHGDGLSMLLAKMTGLTSLALGPPIKYHDTGMSATLVTLLESTAPLETFRGQKMGDICVSALFQHHKTLKHVNLADFNGSISKLMTGWPESVPQLVLELSGTGEPQPSSGNFGLFGPGSLRVLVASLHTPIIASLSEQAVGLKELRFDKIFHSRMADVAPILASSGLEVLHLTLPPNLKINPRSKTQTDCEYFWENLATSKTLRDLQVQNQLNEYTVKNGLSMVGKFLKTNRSVRSIGFDGSFALDLESVKILRSAFYGNKKVISMQYPKSAEELARTRFRAECQRCMKEVTFCKREIKKLFKRAYSKYNRNWRDRPNREKLPYVDRIREAKRTISRSTRNMEKIGILLGEIKSQIRSNNGDFDAIQKVKTATKMERKAPTISRLAEKKMKAVGKIVTKLHKAKERGRKKKTAKQQIPRAAYYQDHSLWPSSVQSKFHHNSSRWRPFNDPFDTRFTYWNGFYGYHHYYPYYSHHHNHSHWQRDDYLDNDNYVPPEEPDQTDQIDGSGVEVEPEVSMEVEPEVSVEPTLPPYIVDPNQEVGDISTSDSWDGVVSDPLMNEQVTRDPWGSMDTLMTSDPTMTDIASILPDIHDEAAELGPDVLADIAPMLDEVAAIDSSIAQTAASVGVDPGIINSAVDSRVIDSGFDSNLLQENLGDIDNYDVGDGDLVDMYAAAGPRDLDDGGPSFGDNSSAVLATNSFTRRIRKKKREMVKVRKALATCSFSGYRHSIFPISPDLNGKAESASHIWPDKVQETWNALVQETKIDVIASSDLFSFPEVSIPEEVIGWNQDLLSSSPSFMVTLVTQCSLDRLKNLEELLARWKGSASVAVFIGDDDDKENAKALISGCIGRAHQRAQKANGEENSQWDVAVNLMQSIVPDSPYPINLLRNVALLAAKEHQRNLGVIDHAAVFLVDVDFRPSNNLHETLLSVNAADKIIQQKKAAVCPAFETKAGTDSPKRVSELISLFETAEADGFHVGHFPQGHSPTDFAEFTLRSRHLDEGSAIDCWKMAYEVRYIEGFEPYIVMATNYVPLYDERFQGYGLNKVSHLASVAKKTGGTFTVLPGVFVSAPEHQKSGSWSSIYGSSSIDAKFNRLCLKGLYRNFCARLQDEKEVMVSASTRCWNNKLTRLVNIDSLIVRPGLTSILDSVSPLPKGNYFMSLYLCLLQEIITQHMAKGEEGGMVNFQKGQHLNLKSTNVMEKLSSCVVESENEGEEGRLTRDILTNFFLESS